MGRKAPAMVQEQVPSVEACIRCLLNTDKRQLYAWICGGDVNSASFHRNCSICWSDLLQV